MPPAAGKTEGPMPLPELFENRLTLPAIAAPMFLVSGPEMVIETCKAGVVGSFPSLNARPAEAFAEWLDRIEGELAAATASNGGPVAPYAVNLIIHRTNPRFEPDLAVCIERKVPVVITSVGNPTDVVREIHAYGGIVLHDVTNVHHARKAAQAGVDGLILVCAGAGGHAGVQSPFALVPQVRAFWDGPLVLAGAISDGRAIRAALVLGADLVYMGTRFLATRESMASEEYKRMVVGSEARDLIYTDAFSGVNANYLRPSIERAGLDPDNLPTKGGADLAALGDASKRAWKDIWSAGQGVGSIADVPTVAELVARLAVEYRDAGAMEAVA
jgi:nitronate monooxygenase